MIDIRSDTVTLPTDPMRDAMAQADLGDDVYGEDPTVNQLQELAAREIGKQAALLVPSGTMGNLIAILAYCGRGDEAIMGQQSHTFINEAGGVSAFGGVHPFTVPNAPDGTLPLNAVRRAIRGNDPHHPVTRCITFENTHNRCGGVPLSIEYSRDLGAVAREHGLKLHLDGARIFNAAAAQGVRVQDLCAPADSVMFCLSKGLCAPVGSILCGDQEFIRRAHRLRKALGGGMRQAGVLAAAGIVALQSSTERLLEDHARAHALAGGLEGLPGLHLRFGMPATNMVFLDFEEHLAAEDLAARLAARGIRVGLSGLNGMRLVTHYWIRDEHVQQVIHAFRELLPLG
jgi:threonine aldolase